MHWMPQCVSERPSGAPKHAADSTCRQFSNAVCAAAMRKKPTRSSRVWQSPAKRLALPALPASSLQTRVISSRVALGLSFIRYLPQGAGCAGGGVQEE